MDRERNKDDCGHAAGCGELRQLRVLDLFAGCGGMSTGFEQAGRFRTVGACQWEEDRPGIARTFKENHPDTILVDADITLPETKDRICGIFREKPCDVVIGGPPCVAFSMSGRRDPADPRGRLFEDYLAIVGVLRPSVVVMENVRGILSKRKGEENPPITEVIAGLERLGYRVEHRVLNAADFGVPQCRQRVIIIGTRLGVPIRFPFPSHAAGGSILGDMKPWVTVRDAIADLQDAPEDREFMHLHVRSGSEFVDRIRATPPGKSASHGYREGFQRLWADRPAFTIKGSNGGVPIHFQRDRLITPREMARLQGFPDSFRFLETKRDAQLMIGNAVPIGLAKAVAGGVLEMLDGAERSPCMACTVQPATPICGLGGLTRLARSCELANRRTGELSARLALGVLTWHNPTMKTKAEACSRGDKFWRAKISEAKELLGRENESGKEARRLSVEATVWAFRLGKLLHELPKGYGENVIGIFSEDSGIPEGTLRDRIYLYRGCVDEGHIKKFPQLGRDYYQALGRIVNGFFPKKVLPDNHTVLDTYIHGRLLVNPLLITGSDGQDIGDAGAVSEAGRILKHFHRVVEKSETLTLVLRGCRIEWNPHPAGGEVLVFVIPSEKKPLNKEAVEAFQAELIRLFHDIYSLANTKIQGTIKRGNGLNPVDYISPVTLFAATPGQNPVARAIIHHDDRERLMSSIIEFQPVDDKEPCRLVRGRCEAILKKDVFLKPRSVDLVITDPPYGEDYYLDASRPHTKVEHDAEPTTVECARLVGKVARLLVQNAIIKERFIWFNFFPLDYAHEFIPPVLDAFKGMDIIWQVLVWNKVNGMKPGGHQTFRRDVEGILYVNVGQRPLANSIDGEACRLHSNLLTFPRVTPKELEDRLYWKPIALLKRLIRLATYATDDANSTSQIVLDPFAGSGSTAVAAIQCRRDYRLIENHPEQFKIAQANVAEARSQKTGTQKEDKPAKAGTQKTDKPAKAAYGTREWASKNCNILHGCQHDCAYCFSKKNAVRFKRITPADWKTPTVNPTIVQKAWRKHEGTIMFPSSHDLHPDNLEDCLTVLRNILSAGNRVLVVSKPHLTCIKRLCRELTEFKPLLLFRFTIGSADNAVLKAWEPGAPPFRERLASLKHAFDAGYQTSVSCEPMLDGDIHAVIAATKPFVTDAIWLGRANGLKAAVSLNRPDDEVAQQMTADLIALMSDGYIKTLYARYQADPKIKWKDSIKKVMELTRPTEKGRDV